MKEVEGSGQRRRRMGLCVAAWLASASLPSLAAEIKIDPESPKEFPVISVTGVFEDGDDRKFTALAINMDSALVVFESPGGDLLAGLGIGRAIRLKEFATAVDDGAECASACGLAWLGGMKRFAHPGARIGFHAAYIETDGKAAESGSGNALVGAYLNQLSLPQSAIVYLTQAPPHGMEWLPLEEARNYGIDLEIIGPPEPGKANGDDIAAALSGNTVKGKMQDSGAYEEFYAADGAIRGDGYEGAWRIDGESMCFKYGENPEACWEVKIDGGQVTWMKDGEEEGTGEIIEGNPNGF